MEIIISHQRTDFDGLASMVAVQKLYPQAIMVFSGKVTNNVKKFMALYKDRITIKHSRDIDKAKVDRVIMVDTRVASRVGSFSNLVQKDEIDVLIYDHHLDRNKNLENAREIVKSVGATTTLLVNELKQKSIEITSFEATLFALGIYEDTGCLVYKSTTAADAKAVAYLLEQGANLEIVEEYIEYSLDRKQHQLFNKLLDSLHQISVKGFKIDVFQSETEEYIPDISLLAHKLNELHNADALFVLVKYDHKILIIGRSNNDSINIAEILKYYGGGGHDRAASATLKVKEDKSLMDYQEELICTINEKVTPAILVEDIMSTPVKTVTPDVSMGEADEIMLRSGYSGLIVLDNEEIKGIISRRDIDKVRKHGLLHAPVKGYMSSNIVSINAKSSLKEVQDTIVDHDIGRLPVVDEQGELVGIVSRSDLLKLFYGKDDYLKNKQNLYGRSLVQVQEKRYDITDKLNLVEQEIITLLKEAGNLADQMDIKLYIVGGFPRDLLLERVNLDLDLVVEGDGVEFARRFAQKLKGELDIYHEFGTAVLSLENNLKVDIASTRVEYYSEVASLPEVESGSIQQDLFRRDFSINALAIQLNSSSFGQLVDYFNGKNDLEAGIIRLLHNFSLYDDPTRIFRGLRFASRYGFKFEPRTKELIRQAVDLDVIEKLSNNRLFNKLELGLKDRYPIKFINLLQEENILNYISKNISWDESKESLANNIKKVLRWLDELKVSFNFDEWILYLMVLISGVEEEDVKEFNKRFNLKNNISYRLLNTLDVDNIITKLDKVESNSEVYYLLEGLAIEDIVLILIKDFSLREKVRLYLEELRWIDIKISGDDIIEFGIQPGPLFTEILKAIKKAKLDDKINSYEEEKKFLENYIAERNG
ncbi:CBS domain-containing protein [Orenia marismortui]|uniref:tRNA nucleotidyltransferase (CCA-adding enzyme) n=1 Tax=Orenia marismortui TaxID=46469 RepID=A0A4R8GHP3_9FIRM|nr:CBS domain-containing protein [Orenia marismortui]TDX45200.1 tRNA nucleotidyltransferase (CCA-adding enzyme) [Orenia marismortui]